MVTQKLTNHFFRTSTSTRKRIGELATRSTPKEVITEMTREKGGELEARGFGSLPHWLSFSCIVRVCC